MTTHASRVRSPQQPVADRQSPETIQYRLDAVEDSLRLLTTKLEQAVGTLGGQMTALQSTMTAFQQSMPEHYPPRREAMERHQAIADRFVDTEKRWEERVKNVDRTIDRIQKRMDTFEARGWQIIAGVLLAVLTGVISLIRTLPPVAH